MKKVKNVRLKSFQVISHDNVYAYAARVIIEGNQGFILIEDCCKHEVGLDFEGLDPLDDFPVEVLKEVDRFCSYNKHLVNSISSSIMEVIAEFGVDMVKRRFYNMSKMDLLPESILELNEGWYTEVGFTNLLNNICEQVLKNYEKDETWNALESMGLFEGSDL